jgi:hypothetical protein
MFILSLRLCSGKSQGWSIDDQTRSATRFTRFPRPTFAASLCCRSWTSPERRQRCRCGIISPGGGRGAPGSRGSLSEPSNDPPMLRSEDLYQLGPVWSPKSAPIWRRRRKIAARKALLLEASRKTIRSGMKAVPGARRLILTTQFLGRDASGHEGEHANRQRYALKPHSSNSRC